MSFFLSTCYSDTGYYGMDWFDAMQCCYYQVPGLQCNGLSPSFYSGTYLQHGYVAEPLSQEEHDQISQYLTICAYIHRTSNFVVHQRKCEN